MTTRSCYSLAVQKNGADPHRETYIHTWTSPDGQIRAARPYYLLAIKKIAGTLHDFAVHVYAHETVGHDTQDLLSTRLAISWGRCVEYLVHPQMYKCQFCYQSFHEFFDETWFEVWVEDELEDWAPVHREYVCIYLVSVFAHLLVKSLVWIRLESKPESMISGNTGLVHMSVYMYMWMYVCNITYKISLMNYIRLRLWCRCYLNIHIHTYTCCIP